MSVDFTKPIRRIRKPNDEIRYLIHRKVADPSLATVVYLSSMKDGTDHIYIGHENEFENIPESRWLNVYVTDRKDGVYPMWRKSMQECLSSAGQSCIGMLEDKQDGSPYIFHPKT